MDMAREVLIVCKRVYFPFLESPPAGYFGSSLNLFMLTYCDILGLRSQLAYTKQNKDKVKKIGSIWFMA